MPANRIRTTKRKSTKAKPKPKPKVTYEVKSHAVLPVIRSRNRYGELEPGGKNLPVVKEGDRVVFRGKAGGFGYAKAGEFTCSMKDLEQLIEELKKEPKLIINKGGTSASSK